MFLKIVETTGDALEPTTYLEDKTKFPIILHQCNIYGVMGSGIAAQVKEKATDAYNRYLMEHRFFGLRSNGNISFGYLNTNRGIVANCQTQEDTGENLNTTVYSAIETSAKYIKEMVKNARMPLCIVIPKNYGCGIANGDWNKVKQIFVDTFSDLSTTLYIVEWKKESEDGNTTLAN